MNDRTIPRVEISFPDFIRKAVSDAEPLSQNTSENNLGFGWIYYGLIRNLRPGFAIAIGSRRGFMPFCAARAMQDNGSGHVIFIDPSYSGGGHPGWGGGSLWNDPAEVSRRIASFGLTDWITHLKLTSEEAFPQVQERTFGAKVGVVIIDGAHTFDHSMRDFELYSPLIEDGFCIFHDSVSVLCDVPRTIHALRTRGLHAVTFHREVGLTVVEISNPPSVEDTWGYLCRASNRAELLLQHAHSILRPGDRVFDAYCGCSPLAPHLKDVRLFGWDRDPKVIQRLRQTLREHRWAVIDESHLPFADLPDEIDVLFGLGISRGHEWWDAQRVLDNVRYLLGRYAPRACLFESAAGYHDADILDDLRSAVARLNYSCQEALIDTDLASFSRRKVLIAEKA